MLKTVKKYLNKYGTVLSTDLNKDVVPENTFLWTVQLYLLLLAAKRYEEAEYLVPKLQDFFYSCIGNDGYFVNIPIKEFANPDDKKVSKDQLIAYSAWSVFTKTNHARVIANQLKRFKYKDNFIHPKEYAALKIMGGYNTWYWRSVYVLTNMYTFRHGTKTRPTLPDSIKLFFKNDFTWPHRDSIQKTDGELLYWVTRETYGVISTGLDEYANTHIKERFGGWRGVFERYYWQHKDHPNKLVAREVYE